MSSLSSLRQGLAQAQEKQRDLAQENAILRESNEQLLSSAFDLEKERQHLARQNALKVQIAQLETTLREVYIMIYPWIKKKYVNPLQCWALAPLLAPPRHWRELKKVAHVAVARK